ncbi:MAG: response regulator [Rhodospirillales bacterium]|nr:response regulator [Rhodospirillales bacterium]
MSGETSGSPAGRSILLVEDEILICLLIETILGDAGYEVVVTNSIPEALDAIDQRPLAAAILDLNLKGEKVFPVAEKLAALGTPFVFATGGGGRDIVGFPGRPWVGKPFQESELLAAIEKLLV